VLLSGTGYKWLQCRLFCLHVLLDAVSWTSPNAVCCATNALEFKMRDHSAEISALCSTGAEQYPAEIQNKTRYSVSGTALFASAVYGVPYVAVQLSSTMPLYFSQLHKHVTTD